MKTIIDISEESLKNISNAFEFGEDITKRTIDIILDAITKSTPISDNATNGDMIKALFPREYEALPVNIDRASWWNAPYKRGETE